MQIHTFYFNPYRECTYVLTNGSNEAVIIDPGMYGEREEARMAEYLKKENLQPVAALITHAHPDHICGIEWLQEQYPNLPLYGQIYQVPPTTIIGLEMQTIATPGHKEDALCYYFPTEQTVFTGDTLFQESVGRTDLPGGDTAQLMQSLQLLLALPHDTEVYPGHGYQTTILHEIENNPYVG